MSAKFPRGGGSKPILSHPSIGAPWSVLLNVSYHKEKKIRFYVLLFEYLDQHCLSMAQNKDARSFMGLPGLARPSNLWTSKFCFLLLESL